MLRVPGRGQRRRSRAVPRLFASGDRKVDQHVVLALVGGLVALEVQHNAPGCEEARRVRRELIASPIRWLFADCGLT